ncbi:hypothetical protein ACXGQW_11665 [Wenyingzhuangia sp. IMCC45533]
MSKKDFFIIIIKLLALYALINMLFTHIPTSLSYINFTSANFVVIMSSVATLLLIILLFWYVLSRASWIVTKLNLAKGFDDDSIDFGDLSSKSIIKIAIIFIGGWLLIKNLPIFINHSYLYFLASATKKGVIQSKAMNMFPYGRYPDYFNWSISIINLVVGYILITNYKRIADKFSK